MERKLSHFPISQGASKSTANPRVESVQLQTDSPANGRGFTGAVVTGGGVKSVTGQQRKCQCCSQWYSPAHRQQKYCNRACRQKAYRQRNAPRRKLPTKSRPLQERACLYCRESYWSNSTAAQKYCTVSCRTMAYRRRRGNAVDTLAQWLNVPRETVADMDEMYGAAKLRSLLEDNGFVYDEIRRCWVPTSNAVEAVV